MSRRASELGVARIRELGPGWAAGRASEAGETAAPAARTAKQHPEGPRIARPNDGVVRVGALDMRRGS